MLQMNFSVLEGADDCGVSGNTAHSSKLAATRRRLRWREAAPPAHVVRMALVRYESHRSGRTKYQGLLYNRKTTYFL